MEPNSEHYSLLASSTYKNRFHHARQSSYDKDKALCRIRSPVRIVLWSGQSFARFVVRQNRIPSVTLAQE